MDLSLINQVFEFIIGTATIGGFLYGGWRMVIQPIRNILNKIEKLETSIETVNVEVIPVIQSLSKEFSKNSGKSIMDRILRIDDNTRLAELRSKLIASNLFTTCIIEFDRIGNLIWANKAFTSLTGMDLADLSLNGWFITIVETDRSRVWTLWRHSIDSNIPFESEFTIKNQITNVEKLVKCIVMPHKSIDVSAAHPILGYYGTIVDVI